MSESSSISLERILYIGRVVMEYYKQATFEPSLTDFDLWIESLKEPMKSNFKMMGYEKCKGILNFKRFVLELKGYGMIDFLKRNLSAEDFAWWNGNSDD